MVKAIGMTFGIVGWIAILSSVWWGIGWVGRRSRRKAEAAMLAELMKRWQR